MRNAFLTGLLLVASTQCHAVTGAIVDSDRNPEVIELHVSTSYKQLTSNKIIKGYVKLFAPATENVTKHVKKVFPEAKLDEKGQYDQLFKVPVLIGKNINTCTGNQICLKFKQTANAVFLAMGEEAGEFFNYYLSQAEVYVNIKNDTKKDVTFYTYSGYTLSENGEYPVCNTFLTYKPQETFNLKISNAAFDTLTLHNTPADYFPNGDIHLGHTILAAVIDTLPPPAKPKK